MAKKEESKAKKEPELPPGVTPEMKEKLDKIKAKLDDFKKKVLEKFDKYIIGIALMPPSRPEEEEEKGEKASPVNLNKINVLIVVDDSDSKKMSKEELQTKLTAIITKIGEEVDKDLNLKVVLNSEIKESCFDGKYDLINAIAMSAPLYDPVDLLAALKISEVHKTMTLKKFEKYIVSYVAAGSLFRGEKSNDIDVYVIIDDTDVKKMSRAELKDKLRTIIVGMSFEASKMTGVQKQFHVQTYILTDFWDNIKDANPVIFTLLRDGVPLYDRGVFMPWKLLLQMGRVKPSPEAIDMSMEIGQKLIERIKAKMLSVVGEDLYYAVLNPAQAALMVYGIPPPTPKETIKLLDEIFVKKEKLLEKKYVDTLDRIRTAYKDIEHGKVKEISGKDIDTMLKDATEYLDRIKELFVQIEERAQKESIMDVHDACVNISKDLLALAGEEDVPSAKLEEKFKEVLVDKEKIPERFLKVLREVQKAKKDFITNKLTKQEVEKVKKEARVFIKTLVEHMQRKRALELEKLKVKVKYGDNKFGELTLFDEVVFITPDLEKRSDLLRAKLQKDGSLTDTKKATFEEFEKYISESSKPSKAFLKEKMFEDLKKILGGDVEILINY